MTGIDSYRSKLEQLKGKRDRADKLCLEATEEMRNLKVRAEDIDRAQIIIQTVAKATQEELEYKISELVSLALEAVFPNPYKLHLDFEMRRGKTEADLAFSRGKSEERIDPLSSTGGGAVDVAAFGLRVASWNLERPQSRAVLMMDEPFRFLSRDLQSKASYILREVSRSLGLQIIIVTHEQTLIESEHTDKVFDVSIRQGVSSVEEIEK